MDELKNVTETELLKRANDIKRDHEKLKKDILVEIEIIDEKQKHVNFMLAKLENLEAKYVELMDALKTKIEESDNK